LTWHDHEIHGKDTYVRPWNQITRFANGIAKALLERFPKTELLEAMEILDPQAWKEARDPFYTKRITLVTSLLMT
jgi:hypothetical protein